MDTESILKKPVLSIDSIHFEAQWTENAPKHTITGEKQRLGLDRVTAEEKSRLESMEPGGPSHRDVKVKDVVMHDSSSAHYSAKVCKYRAKSDSAV